MGLLVDGQWQDRWYDTSKTGGRYIRGDAQFRNWVTADGSVRPTGLGPPGATWPNVGWTWPGPPYRPSASRMPTWRSLTITPTS